VLRTYDIPSLNLNAETIVLSACETALGDLKRGEGMVGMAHAFFLGGASAVLASEWKVADLSTSMLMVRFYTNCAAGISRHEALRAAKLWLLRNAKATDDFGHQVRFAHPFHWAAFVLTEIRC